MTSGKQNLETWQLDGICGGKPIHQNHERKKETALMDSFVTNDLVFSGGSNASDDASPGAQTCTIAQAAVASKTASELIWDSQINAEAVLEAVSADHGDEGH